MEEFFPYKITIKTDSHGEISIDFYKYKNSQIRTGVEIISPFKENIKGALVKRTKPKDIILKNLNDTKFVKNSEYNNTRIIEEHFMKDNIFQKVEINY